jgi:hypothetical protein
MIEFHKLASSYLFTNQLNYGFFPNGSHFFVESGGMYPSAVDFADRSIVGRAQAAPASDTTFT